MRTQLDSAAFECGSKPRRFDISAFISLLVVPLLLLVAVLSGCSENDEDLMERVSELNAQGKLEESSRLLAEAIEGGRNDSETLLAYGMTLSAMQHYSQAFWPLKEAAEDPQYMKPASMQLASNALRIENLEIVRRATTRVLEEEPENVAALMLRGEASLKSRRNYEEALEDFELILELEPDHQRAMRSKATALLGLKRPEEALEMIKEAAALAESEGEDGLAETDPEEYERTNAFWCIIEASYAKDSGKSEESEQLYEDCITRHPADAFVVKEVVELHRNAGDWDRIEEILRTAYEKAPDQRDFRIALVLNLETQGRAEEGLAILREATEHAVDAPSMAAAWRDLAGYLKQNGQISEALEAYEKARTAIDEPQPELLFAMAEAYIVDEQYDAALFVIEDSNIRVHRLMVAGRVALERGDDAAAFEKFTEAVTLWPDNAPARYYTGLAAERVGDFDRAIEEYRHTIRAADSMLEGRQRLARLHMAEGFDESALAMLRQTRSPEGVRLDLETRLLEFEILGRLGRSIANVSNIPYGEGEDPKEVEARAYEAIASGMRHGRGPGPVIEFLEPIVGTEPGEAFAGPFLIYIEELIQAGRIDHAVDVAKRAVAAHPDVSGYAVSLAIAEMAKAGEAEAGRASLARALELDDRNVEALVRLGRIDLARESKESKEDALKSFEKAFSENSESSAAAMGIVDALVALDRNQDAEARIEEMLRVDLPFDGTLALRLAELRNERGVPAERTRALVERARRFGAGPKADQLARKGSETE
jgi:tetratricopeptide (TPR) repeat protein